ncbi:MAG: hypothetical protein WC225_04845 [Acholeplasmataceae bacterium]|nr:hypothetical protein [Acholeplasmataceae bacterium]
MQKKKFVVSKATLIFVMLFSFLAGFIFGDTNNSESFFTKGLLIRAVIVAIIGGSIVALVSYLQYKKNNNSEK